MVSASQTVRVFISSTFRDMHAERDHLVTVVFPELRERIEQLGLEFFDVDLRWGVPAKDANGETANSWEYCRQWIDRVEPFFVCILGQRHGYRPEPRELHDPSEQAHQLAQRRSITELEVRHAVLNDRRKRRSYFYLRKTPVPELPPDATDEQRHIHDEFVDPPEQLAQLDALKADIRTCGRPVRGYTCRWTGKEFADLDKAEKKFGPMVLEDLWSGVLRDERYVSKEVWRQVLKSDPETDARYTDESQPIPEELWKEIVEAAKPKPKDPLDADREQMESFAKARLRWFQGRSKELQQLTDFINSTDEKAPRLAVVAAVPGQGKSALLARLWDDLTTSINSALLTPQSVIVIAHFVGATERSASSHALVQRLLDELDRSGIQWPAEGQKQGEKPKRDFNSLCNRLANRLRDYAGEHRIILLLDALNQLSDGHGLVWLPYKLGPQVRVVVSCVDSPSPAVAGEGCRKPSEDLTREQQVLVALERWKEKTLRVPVGPLTEANVREIVVKYLEEYCKELDERHVTALCKVPQASNPLYLLVMLGELRTLGGDEMNKKVPELLAELQVRHPDAVSLFRWVLQRLEVFGAEAVRWWCLYLAHGRVGMASHELADLLVRKLDSNAEATSLLIERGLRRYLQRRGGQLDFFHSQLRQAVFEQYASQAGKVVVHFEIAEYFEAQEYFLKSLEEQRAQAKRLPPRPVNVRKVDELPWQRLTVAKLSGEWDGVARMFTDLFFLEAKAEAGMIFELADDFREAVQQMPHWHNCRHVIEVFGNIINLDAQVLHNHIREYPQLLFQTLWNQGWQVAESEHSHGVTQSGIPVVKVLEQCRAQFEGWNFGRGWIRLLRPVTESGGREGLRAVLLGHQSFVSTLRVNHDGRICVSASHDRNLIVWDLRQHRQIRELVGHLAEVVGVAITPDGYTAVSVAMDLSVRFWHVPSGLSVCIKEVHGSTPDEVAITPDGKTAITISRRENVIRVWRTDEGSDDTCQLPDSRDVDGATRRSEKNLPSLERHSTSSIVIDSQGQRAAIAVHGVVMLFNLTTRTFIPILSVPCEAITFTLDGTALFCAAGKEIHLCDCSTMETHLALAGHTNEVYYLEALAHGLLVSADRNGTVRLWDISAYKELESFQIEGRVAATWLEEGKLHLAGKAPDGAVFIHAVQNGGRSPVTEDEPGQSKGLEIELRDVCISDDGALGMGASEKRVTVWDTKEVKLLSESKPRNQVTSAALSGSGAVACAVTREGLLLVLDPVSGSWRASYEIKNDGPRILDMNISQPFMLQSANLLAVGLSGRGDIAIVGTEDRSVILWNLSTGKAIAALAGHQYPVEAVAINGAGEWCITGSGNTLRIYRLPNESPLHTIVERTHIASVSISRKGDLGVSAVGRVINVWSTRDGRKLGTLCGHLGKVSCVSVDPTGRFAVSCSEDYTLRLWSLSDMSCLGLFNVTAHLTCCACNTSKERIVAGDINGQLYFLQHVAAKFGAAD